MIPKVSIIIPVYNVDRYLKECLDSLISQTLVDIEIICINDSSTDNSLSILNEYAQKDNRVKVYNNSENQGLSCTRNVGLGVAIGEYIGFVDSDDYVDKDFFEKLYISASSNDADMARAPYKYLYPNYEKTELRVEKLIRLRARQCRSLCVNEHSSVVWNAIYRRKFLIDNKILYFDNIRSTEDVPYTTRTTFLANKIIPVVDTYLHYRKDVENSISNNISIDKVFAIMQANEITTDFLNSIYGKASFKDYRTAYLKCIWRCRYGLKKGMKLKEFDIDKKAKYLNKFVSILKNYKGSRIDFFSIDFRLLFLLISYKYSN